MKIFLKIMTVTSVEYILWKIGDTKPNRMNSRLRLIVEWTEPSGTTALVTLLCGRFVVS